MDEKTLARLEQMVDESQTVVVPSAVLSDLLESARDYAEKETARIVAAGQKTAYAIGDQVRIDPRHCGVVAAKGFVTDVWAGQEGQEDIYEIMLQFSGTRMIYRASELYPKAAPVEVEA